MESTYATAVAPRPIEGSGIRQAVDRNGLLIFSLIAYGIFWTMAIIAFVGMEAGFIDPEGAFVGVATTLAPAAPLAGALIVLGVSHGRAGLARLARSMVHWRVHPGWYALVFLGIPLVMTVAVLISTGAEGFAALVANADVVVMQLPLGILSIAVFTGIAEEPGWRGYAQPWANRRFSPLVAAVLVSAIWAVWHLPNALFNETLMSAAIHAVATTLNGVVLAWMYNSTRGSVFIVILAHGAINATGGLYFSALADTGIGVERVPYYLLSVVASGMAAVVVVAMTRGRLDMPDSAADQSRLP